VAILSGFLYMILGVFLLWMGAFQFITAMVPKDVGIAFAEQHGAWMREHVFKLPPTKPTPTREAE
jgi:hypothetical protein